MSPKQKRPGKAVGLVAPSVPGQFETVTDLPASRAARRRWLWVGLTMVALAAAVSLYFLVVPAPPPTSLPVSAQTATSSVQPPANFVGAAACKTCHEGEFKAWEGSHHQQSMQAADDATVLGDFNNVKFRHFGVESTFFKRDGKFMVRTDGPDGKLADYAVSRTFGVWPLQQYMVAFPGGRYQMLPIAWDSRTQAEGGQRWFHVSPGEKVNPKDPLHWTGRYQTWNLQCAACHSTNLKKGYDATSDSYTTTFSEINVSCEACHGPASRHLAWAAKARAPYPADSENGLVKLESRWQDAWKFPSASAPHAQRDKRADAAAMNNCAACHARRSTLVEHGAPGAPLEDTHRLAVLTSPTFHADGQQLDEVFVWNSWLQTKMHQSGVTCMDCHDAHTAKLRVEGNAVCARCHNPAVFDTEKHHFHKPGSRGAQCVECHMPEKNYMVVDARRDHAIRVPRPDLSKSIGSPNACTQCHTDRKPDWAATAMDQWYGTTWRNRPQYGTALHAGANRGAAALPSLMALAQDPALPAIVRATAVTLAQPHLGLEALPALRKMLDHTDPTLRIAALGALEPFEPDQRLQAAAPLLGDAVRGVRVEAARTLADIPDAQFPVDRLGARERALTEYLDSLKMDADWPSANANLGNLYLRQRRVDEAIAAFQRAIMLDPQFTDAYLSLADAYRQAGREAEGEKLLRSGMALAPRNPDLHHGLGLLLVRKGDKPAALQELALAARLAPDNARYTYVHAVALHSGGKRTEAITLLRTANSRHPDDLEILSALIAMNREAGDLKAALVYARKAAAVLPGDPGIKRLVAELEAR